MEIPREMQIDALHGNHLAIAPARSASLYAHTGAQRGLSQRETDRLSDPRERVRQTDTRRRLPLARRGRGDRRDQYQPRLTPENTRPFKNIEIDLGDGNTDTIIISSDKSKFDAEMATFLSKHPDLTSERQEEIKEQVRSAL